MNKKVLILTALLIFLSSQAFCEEGYISPENYAVNEADLTDYRDIPAPGKYTNSKPVKQKEYKYKPPGKFEESLKGKLREIRYNAQEDHHGQLHEIKVNSKYKENLQQKQEENNDIED